MVEEAVTTVTTITTTTVTTITIPAIDSNSKGISFETRIRRHVQALLRQNVDMWEQITPVRLWDDKIGPIVPSLKQLSKLGGMSLIQVKKKYFL